jgi:hypothetical protein
MPWYRMPGGDGTVHVNFGGAKATAKNAPKRCRAKRADGTICACMAEFACDWPGCDIPLCRDCVRPAGPTRHLCPDHREQPGLDIGEGLGEQQLDLIPATTRALVELVYSALSYIKGAKNHA